MARYRLTTPHYSEEDKLLEASDDKPIEVGDGTPHKWTRAPTPEMEGVDTEGKKRVEAVRARMPDINPIDKLAMTMGAPDDE